ncbi:MAG: hypothetical protein V7603_623 [Micromonosporaceae bacterium]
MSENVPLLGKNVVVYDLSQALSNSTGSFQPNRHHIEYVSAEQSVAMTGAAFGTGPEYWPTARGTASSGWTCPRTPVPTWTRRTTTGRRRPGTHRRRDPAALVHRPRRAAGHAPQGPTGEHPAGRPPAEFKRLGHDPRPYGIPLIWTGVSAHFDAPGYDSMHPGLRRDGQRRLGTGRRAVPGGFLTDRSGWRRRTGIEPAWPRYSATSVLKTAEATRRPHASALHTRRRRRQ